MKKNYLTERNFTASFDVSIKTKSLFKNTSILLLIIFGFSNTFGQVGSVPSVGNNSYSMCSGNLYDSGGSGGNYANNSNGYTVLNPTVVGNFVRVSGTINSEAGWDYLTIYDGTGTGGTVLWGGSAHGTGTACTAFIVPTITSTTGPLTVRFNSDGSKTCAGFNLVVSCFSPPPTITNLLTASNGCVGSNITITGTNLNGATAANVKIGGTPVSSIISNNATTIVAVIGAGTTGTVSVTTPGGTATSAGTFTVNPLPAAIAGSSTLCTGDTITLTDATAGGTWSIVNGTGTGIISGTGDVTGNSAGTLTVTYTLPTTCTITKVLTVQDPPGSIAGGAAAVCVGSSTPAFTNPNAGGTWSVVNETGTATITAGGVLTGSATGTVTVYYTIGTCPPVSYTVTVNPTPVSIGGAATVCTGATTTLTNATPGGTWSIVNGTGSATISVTGDVSGVTAGAGVTVSYTLLPTTCNVTKSLTVQQTPGAIAGGAAAVCVGSSTPAFTNPNAGGTWSVVNGSGAGTITGGGILTGTTAGTLTVNYTIGLCTPATFAVTVNPTPVAIVGAATVCTGATTTLTNATPGGTWSIVNGTGSATITATGDVSGVTAGAGVNVSYTLLPNCSVTKSLTVQQTPGAIAGGAVAVCVGSSTPAFTNPNAGGTWSVVNGSGAGTITGGGILTGTAAGTVTVNYTIGLCTPATFAVTVNPTPVAIVGAATVCTGATTTLTNGTPGGTWSIANGTGSATISATGDVSGLTAGAGVTVSYTLLTTTCNVTKSLTVQQTPGAIAGGAVAVCVGSSTPAFTNPNAGGTWSVVNGSGAGTITGGGILTGTAAGTVTIKYTIGLCTAATYSVTINSIPANPSNPSSNSPQCVPPGVTLTRTGTPPGTENHYWQTTSLGTNTTNNSSTYNTTTGGTYYIRAQNISSGCWSTGQGSLAVIITPNLNTLASIPNPANAATGVCYIGSSPVSSLSWTAAAGATSYDVYFGAGSLPGSVTSNVATTTYSTGNLLASTTYYWKIVPKNPCGVTSGSPITWTFTTSSTPCYCAPTVSNTYQLYSYINQISFLGNLTNPPINNSTYSSAPLGYQDFTALTKATQAQGEGVNIFMNTTNGANFMKAWVDWNKNGVFETSEIVYQCTNPFINTTFGFQIPATSLPGDYRIRMRIISANNGSNTYDACTFYNNVDGETEDYLFSVVANCSAKITSITNGFTCGTGSVTLNAVGSPGTTEYRWYTTATGGTYTSSPTSSWNTPSISTTTTYYVTAYNGTCESLYRSAVIATIKKIPTLTFTNSDPEICGENNVIDLTATGSNEQIFLVDENFEGATISFTNNQIASPNGAITNWQVRSSTYVPAYPAYPVWYPAISSGFGTNKFIMSTSDLSAGGNVAGKVNEALELTTAVNTTGFINLTMSFKIYFSSYYDSNNANTEGVFIQINTGAGWVNTPIISYLGDEGIGTNFVTKTINMNAYININTLKVRIRYRAGWCDGVAIDDIKLFGDKPLLPNFTWTSGFPIDAYTNLLCTPPYAYIAGTPISTVYVKPTLAQLENGTFLFTANANLTNGCTTSGTITVTNKSKVWKGLNGNWNDAGNWMPVGIPDATNCVIISTAPNNCSVGVANFNGYAKTLQVLNNGNLTINSTNSLIITDFVEVRGTTSVFTIQDSGSLLQINDAVVNKGNIFYKRIAPNIKGSDYIYWSSPVENQNMGTIYDPIFPYSSGVKYQWNTTLNNGNGTGGNICQGLWEAASGIMTRARGYIIRGSSNFGMPVSNIPTTFNGVPFNGAISYTVQRGVYTGLPYNGANTIQITNLNDNYNLLGNPYPSSINALKFLRLNAYNSVSNPTGVLLGNVKLWRHGIDPMQGAVNPFYGSYQINYDANDYLTINYLGGTEPGPVDIIKSGQAFFVQMIDGPTGSGIVNFNNSMRFDDANLPYNNSGFFKHGNVKTEEIASEKHRIWLALTDANNKSSGMLVGYATAATNNYDNLFDAPTGIPSGLKVFSMIENNIDVYEIQGRTLPFDINDEIAIGIVAPTSGNYTFALAGVDGLFDTQNVYLKDTLLNTTHNLKTSPYTFTTTSGVNKDRFKIVYIDNTLGNPDYSIENTIKVLTNTEVAVSSSTLQMESIAVYTILGQKLNMYKNINSNYVILSNLHKNNTTLLLKIKLQTDEIITKKIIF